jgi:hypothetical protein
MSLADSFSMQTFPCPPVYAISDWSLSKMRHRQSAKTFLSEAP